MTIPREDLPAYQYVFDEEWRNLKQKRREADQSEERRAESEQCRERAQAHRGEGSSNQSSLPPNPRVPGLHQCKEPAARVPRIHEQGRRDIVRKLDSNHGPVDNTAPAPRDAIIAAVEALRGVAAALPSEAHPRHATRPARSRLTEPEVTPITEAVRRPILADRRTVLVTYATGLHGVTSNVPATYATGLSRIRSTTATSCARILAM